MDHLCLQCSNALALLAMKMKRYCSYNFLVQQSLFTYVIMTEKDQTTFIWRKCWIDLLSNLEKVPNRGRWTRIFHRNKYNSWSELFAWYVTATKEQISWSKLTRKLHEYEPENCSACQSSFLFAFLCNNLATTK